MLRPLMKGCFLLRAFGNDIVSKREKVLAMPPGFFFRIQMSVSARSRNQDALFPILNDELLQRTFTSRFSFTQTEACGIQPIRVHF